MISQSFEIIGKIQSTIGVENIHVINQASQQFTISDKNGVFKISAKLLDTLTFSSVQHKLKTVVVDRNIQSFKTILVTLQENVIELDEILVGKVLTGDLNLDVGNVKKNTSVNFYDVGIPGYKGKIATPSERRLNEATSGGGFGGVSLNSIINGLSGRTKMLKNRVNIDKREALLQSVKARLSKDFFASNPLENDLKNDFFYFCADDENFIKFCKNQTDFKILIFLRMKYRQYINNRSQKKD
ncbi:hypothetical protein APS56_13810 [Pseudalgibacter alginicilyticus]|uniref:Uncharacterized protein n=2 Tax=Pseudalgibacter alginicilyticus TaxID=1736674 RepID=A0A0P0CNY2_9FLAO|nr:hypothetical protein APS56_13810 [Pseudalgibacter alginicilyticus]